MAKTREQLKCPLIEDWIKSMYIYTMEQYSAMRNDEILPFATTRMDLDNTMLSEISQSEKVKNCIVSVTCGIQK